MQSLTVNINVDTDKRIGSLVNLAGLVEQLIDMMPDWNRFEADKIAKKAREEINNLIEVE